MEINMNFNGSVVRAVFWRNFAAYFANPVGYLFVFAFTLAAAYFAFNDQFFAANMADLDQLNAVYSLLALLLVPAITMSAWAEERRSGTEELLLTLPGSDFSIVLGKYFACLGIYTVALAFSTVYIILLEYLGEPDYGLIGSTYLGYWFIGAALVAAGMVASLLTSHTTVAFIIGVLICGILVGVARIDDVVTYVGNLFASLGWIKTTDAGSGIGSGGFVKEFLPRLSVEGSFRHSFGRGVMTLSAFWYFLAVTFVMLYLNVFLLGRRHWSGGEHAPRQWTHGLVRTVALIVSAVSLYVFARRADAVAFIDATSERLHALSAQTVDVLKGIPADREVRIEAFLSPVKDLPKEYVEVHRNLRDKLLQYDAQGRGRIALTIHETELFSPQAERADKKFNIKPVRIPVQEEGRMRTAEFILGVAVVSGSTELSLPFFYKGLPVEYELTRLVRTASAKELSQIAVLQTAANIIGRFNQADNDWLIVNDLKKQYKVLQVQPGQLFQYDEAQSTDPGVPKKKTLKRGADGEPLLAESLKSVRCLIAPMPSTLQQEEFNDLVTYMKSGRPTLILEDAACMFDARLTSGDSARRSAMMTGQPPPPPRSLESLEKLATMLGLEFNFQNESAPAFPGAPERGRTMEIVWQNANPLRAESPEYPLEFIASGRGVVEDSLYNREHPITQSMKDFVLFLFPAAMKRKGGDGPEVTPLLWTTREAGTTPADAVHEAAGGPNQDWTLKRKRRNEEFVLAAAIKGKPYDSGSTGEPKDETAAPAKDLNVVFVADLDFIADIIFTVRRQGGRKYDFDNVGFLVNAVDYLAGDQSLIDLRQKRPERRTLTKIADLNKAFEDEASKEAEEAREQAQKAEDEAQKGFEKVAKKLQGQSTIRHSDITELTQKVNEERRKLQRIRDEIVQRRNDNLRDIQSKTQERLRQQQLAIRFLAVTLPALPVLILGLVVWTIRNRRETEGVAQTRLR
jgi:ABC-2 type transport system permease protein